MTAIMLSLKAMQKKTVITDMAVGAAAVSLNSLVEKVAYWTSWNLLKVAQ